MLGIRKVGSLVRGKATPFQVFSAALLGAMIGFVPVGAPFAGLYALLVGLLVLVNANLVLAAGVWVVCELASLALLPVSFALGRLLLDGPGRPLFGFLANAPGTALLGLEHYAAAGGLLVGAGMGCLIGALAVLALTRFRRLMARLESDSSRYQRIVERRWVRFLAFVLIGPGHGKTTYAQMLGKRIGNPVRPLGVVLVVLAGLLLLLIRGFLAEPVVTATLHRGLERVNGASVEVAGAELSLGRGRLAVGGLAMADPEALERDLFRAQALEADLDVDGLLRKRLSLDAVVARHAAVGAKRATPGRLVTPPAEPLPPEADPTETKEGERTLGDLLADAEKWRDRLAQAKRWLDWLATPTDPEADPAARERDVAARVRAYGYAGVRARHLVREAPTLLVRSLEAAGVAVPRSERFEALTVEARNVSTHPGLVDEPLWLRVRSSDERFELVLGRREPASDAEKGAEPVRFRLDGLSGDAVGDAIRIGDRPPVSGGTIDLRGAGAWRPKGLGTIEMTLTAILKDTELRLPGAEPVSVERLELPIGVRGPLTRPRIDLDRGALAKALLEAGKKKALERIAEEAEGFLPKGILEKGKKNGGGGLLDRFLKRGKEEAEGE